MSIKVQLAGRWYNIPVVGENKWGEETTALLQGIVDSLSSIVGPADILTREALLANNVSVPIEVNGLRFDTTSVQNIEVNGVIVRTFPEVLAIEPKKDTFTIIGAAYQGKLEYNITYSGDDAGVLLQGRDDGQFTYTSTDVLNTESIFMKFYGKAVVATEEE